MTEQQTTPVNPDGTDQRPDGQPQNPETNKEPSVEDMKAQIQNLTELVGKLKDSDESRKYRIRDLEAQLEQKSEKDQSSKSLEEKVQDLTQRLNERDQALKDRDTLDRIKTLFPNAIDPEIHSMVLSEVKKRKIDGDSELKEAVEGFKARHPNFVKQDVAPSPAAHPGIKDQVRRPDAPTALGPDEELAAWKKMDRLEQKAYEKQHPGTRERMQRLVSERIAEKMRTSATS